MQPSQAIIPLRRSIIIDLWLICYLCLTDAVVEVSIHATSEDRKYNLTAIAEPVHGPISSPDWRIEIDDTESGARQEIDGFGAAWTDATVEVFSHLPDDKQDDLMKLLFTSKGIDLGLMRHTIGQSDLTPSWIGKWSYDDNEGKADPDLTNFDLGDPGKKMAAWLKRMQEIKSSILLLGSPWSPPGWMKQNNNLQWQYVDSWVDYMIKYLEHFKETGVRVDAVTLQNEPLHSQDEAWTMYMDKSYQAILANKLGPAIRNSSIRTEIWAYDHNTDRPDYPEYVIENASENVQGVAWHCYANPTRWEVLSSFHSKHPTKKQYMTECWTHLKDEDFFSTADFLAGPMQNYASGAMAWTLGGSVEYDVAYPDGCAPCSGIIQVDRKNGEFFKTIDYYTLGQYSKFVHKGSRYMVTNGSWIYPDGSGVTATSFKNPKGNRVVVMLNKFYKPMKLQISFKSGDAWNGNVPSRSITTWVLTASPTS